jgi:hypothetical protein
MRTVALLLAVWLIGCGSSNHATPPPAADAARDALAPIADTRSTATSDSPAADAAADTPAPPADSNSPSPPETTSPSDAATTADASRASDTPAPSDTSAPTGQLWGGILDLARAIDWTHAGVQGGIPNRTTPCAALNPGATGTQMNTAIKNCPAGQVVSLTAGSYAIADTGIVMKSGVTLRGAGADKTLLSFTATTYCNNQNATICFAGTNEWGGDARALPGGSNYADWTAGYAQGANQITLANVGSAGIAIGQFIHLDQANDSTPSTSFFVCDNTTAPCSLEGGNGGRTIQNVLRSQVQIVKVTAISGSTYTIDPPLYSPNWRASQSPAVWWANTLLQDAGVEDLSVDATNSGGMTNVSFVNAANDWLKGTRLLRTCSCQRDLVQMMDAAHITVESNYLFGTQGKSVNYGIESYVATDNLVQNNILQHVVAPMMVQPALGSVLAYNYAVNDTYDDGFSSNPLHWMIGMADQHNAGVEYNLYEGNIGPGIGGDVIHGNQLANTLFRNYLLGSDPGRTDATIAVTFSSYNRYHNVIGNVLGTPGYTKTYEVNSGIGQAGVVYNIGSGDTEGSVTVPDDPLVKQTLLRWGNYDVVNAAARWLPSEVPSGITPLANPVPANQNLPPSFYLTQKPGFWPSGKPWPPIGPDVSSGNLANLGGHASSNPALDCYQAMGGPADGTGNPLTFSAAACYP